VTLLARPLQTLHNFPRVCPFFAISTQVRESDSPFVVPPSGGIARSLVIYPRLPPEGGTTNEPRAVQRSSAVAL